MSALEDTGAQGWFVHVPEDLDPQGQVEVRFLNSAGEHSYFSFNLDIPFDAEGADFLMLDMFAEGIASMRKLHRVSHDELERRQTGARA